MAKGAGGGRGGGDNGAGVPGAAATPSHGDDYPPILTTAMAAELLSVHVEYLRRMVREGRIPAHRFPGGREIRFHRDELIAWVKAQPGHDRSPSAENSDEEAELPTDQTDAS
ncbi:MAG TPA: helix-turn-helix domain-containing protein [Acidimicrobiia bacterium]|jgi:excisionase family DNA binding protein